MEDRDFVQMIFEWLRRLDQAYDFSLIYTALTIAAALSAVWTMQCLTHRAGFQSIPSIGILGIRVILCGLAIVWFMSAGMALYIDTKPWAIDVIERGFCLILMVVVPRIIGGRIGADYLARLAERRALG